MKVVTLALGASTIFMVGCASNQMAVKSSIGQAEASMEASANLDSASTAAAKSKLDSAKIFEADGEDELAVSAASESSLEYRLAVETAELELSKREKVWIEKELRSDLERKLKYQNALLKEKTGGK
ncbi:MAG: hypothetical protein HUK21_01355 [Fibrobacteraceae bacterium]|nr:hypothetical protein [Fibrobacteraceae bacterium]